MDTPRTAYAVNAPNSASEVAGEITAALSAASIAFRSSDPGYSQTLLQNAGKTFQFADMYRGAYSSNEDIKNDVCPFYCDFNGFQVNNKLISIFVSLKKSVTKKINGSLEQGKYVYNMINILLC